MRILLLLILISVFNFVNAQDLIKTENGYIVGLAVVDGDTMPQIRLRQVYVMPKKTYKSTRQKKKFLRLVRRIKKVLPYARLANNTLVKINNELDSIDNKRLQRKHIRRVDKVLKERYGEELKKLTISEGRILIKLIDRETGSTSYELIKELKGSLSAFMWQSLARLFGENLKDDYDPKEEDKLIEEILIRIQAGQY